MLLESDEKYVQNLKLLWKNVFGDEDGYIDLFFKSQYKKSFTFAQFDKNKIICALYLLKCRINLNGEIYNGLYLYAAATDMSYRKKGLMGKLINEAEQFAKNIGYDFVSLVPANEYLYTYYKKFGFQTAMYKAVQGFGGENIQEFNAEEVSVKEYNAKRNAVFTNAFLWNDSEMNYVFDCYGYYGIRAYCSNGYYFIADKNSSILNEFVCSKSEFSNAEKDFCAKKVYSPYAKQKEPFGMIYPINEKLKKDYISSEIYMNHALD